MRKQIVVIILSMVGLSISAQPLGKSNPTMGWSSWNTYHVNISDSLIMVSDASPIATTAIAPAHPNTSEFLHPHYYTPTGIKVSPPLANGIYLCNGKKVIVK